MVLEVMTGEVWCCHLLVTGCPWYGKYMYQVWVPKVWAWGTVLGETVFGRHKFDRYLPRRVPAGWCGCGKQLVHVLS